MHQPITDYWAKYYLLEGKGCILCGNFGILQAQGKASKQTFCICPNGQHLRSEIEVIKSGERNETQTRSTQGQGNSEKHQQVSISMAHV